MLHQIVRHAEETNARRAAGIAAVRLIQPHVMSFDEDSIYASGAESFIADELVAETLFAARVVRAEGKVIGLIPFQDDARTSQAVVNDGERP